MNALLHRARRFYEKGLKTKKRGHRRYSMRDEHRLSILVTKPATRSGTFCYNLPISSTNLKLLT